MAKEAEGGDRGLEKSHFIEIVSVKWEHIWTGSMAHSKMDGNFGTSVTISSIILGPLFDPPVEAKPISLGSKK